MNWSEKNLFQLQTRKWEFHHSGIEERKFGFQLNTILGKKKIINNIIMIA